MTDPLLRYFAWEHLRPAQAAVSRPFADLATGLLALLPPSEERHEALRKLLEAKDCAVRASLPEPPPTAHEKPIAVLLGDDASKAA